MIDAHRSLLRLSMLALALSVVFGPGLSSFLAQSVSAQRLHVNEPGDSPIEVTYPASSNAAAEPSFVFVNQPWDWIEGRATSGATLQASLQRGSVIASAQPVTGSDGWYKFEFRDANGHVDILSGDQVTVRGGGLDATVSVVGIIGAIDVANNSVVGQVTGGSLPAQGLVAVGLPGDVSFITKTVDFNQNGQFVVQFGDVTSLSPDHVAKVVYYDPNGGRVGQIFYPQGLDVRAFISESRVEGITWPYSVVRVLLSDARGPRGSATTTSDATGFYSTPIYDGIRPVRFQLGDHLTVSRPGEVRELDLTMYHTSYIEPWNKRVVGTIQGVTLPRGGTQGKVDLWSEADQRWYTQYVGIGPDGHYGADFSATATRMTEADRVRVWFKGQDGLQQTALGYGLELGVSPTSNLVWGYGTVGATGYITLYQGLVEQRPAGVLGTATVTVDQSGYFSTTITSQGAPVAITPSNIVEAQVGEHRKTLFVGEISAQADLARKLVLLKGPAGALFHIEGRHQGVRREDAPYQADYVWREVKADATGTALVSLGNYTLQPSDWFDVTYYGLDQGQAVHDLLALPSTVFTGTVTFLPIVDKNAQ